jgi:hypothetical protein
MFKTETLKKLADRRDFWMWASLWLIRGKPSVFTGRALILQCRVCDSFLIVLSFSERNIQPPALGEV